MKYLLISLLSLSSIVAHADVNMTYSDEVTSSSTRKNFVQSIAIKGNRVSVFIPGFGTADFNHEKLGLSVSEAVKLVDEFNKADDKLLVLRVSVSGDIEKINIDYNYSRGKK